MAVRGKPGDIPRPPSQRRFARPDKTKTTHLKHNARDKANADKTTSPVSKNYNCFTDTSAMGFYRAEIMRREFEFTWHQQEQLEERTLHVELLCFARMFLISWLALKIQPTQKVSWWSVWSIFLVILLNGSKVWDTGTWSWSHITSWIRGKT